MAAPLDEDRNVSFFYWTLVLFGHNNAQRDILGIHDYPLQVGGAKWLVDWMFCYAKV